MKTLKAKRSATCYKCGFGVNVGDKIQLVRVLGNAGPFKPVKVQNDGASLVAVHVEC